MFCLNLWNFSKYSLAVNVPNKFNKSSTCSLGFNLWFKMVLQKIIYQVAKKLGKDVALREENNIWNRNDINLKEAGNVGSATLPSRFLRLWHHILIYFIYGIFFISIIIYLLLFWSGSPGNYFQEWKCKWRHDVNTSTIPFLPPANKWWWCGWSDIFWWTAHCWKGCECDFLSGKWLHPKGPLGRHQSPIGGLACSC